MDIFEFALSKERYSEDYYRKLAARSPSVGLKNILTMLADEETKHYETIRQMRDRTPATVTDAPVLAHATEEFERIRGTAEKFDFHIDEVRLYRKACDIEEQSRRYYQEKARETEDPQQQRLFLQLAEEENKHLRVVQAICDFVARPETFLENAEMYHFDDYVEGVY